MTQFLNLVLSGLVTGAIYSIMASGLVLTYTTSGIFNFAHGAIAFSTAYLYYQLNYGRHWSTVAALILSVFLGILGVQSIILGLLAEILIRIYYENKNERPYRVARVVGPAPLG